MFGNLKRTLHSRGMFRKLLQRRQTRELPHRQLHKLFTAQTTTTYLSI